MILDTALDYSYLALLDDENLIYESYEIGKANHSETLMPKLELALKDNNVSLKDLDEIYVGIGPGSYTGVRIAVVVCKMLAAMNNTKLYAISSLAVLASSRGEKCVPLVDCRRGRCYTATFDYENGIQKRVSDDEVKEIVSLLNETDESLIVKEGKPNPIVILNSTAKTYVEDPNSLSPNYLQLVEAERIKMGLK